MHLSKTTKKCSCICIVGVLLAIFFVPPHACLADKGAWHLSTEPVTLTESGQRAIIGWGGETEILCLATDVSSSKETTVIEFLPLPSEPNVTLGGRETFEAAEKLLARRGVKLTMPAAGGPGPSVESEPFHITFHKRLGAHDVTVVKVNKPDEFADWIQEKAKALTGGRMSLPNSIRKLIAKYRYDYHCPYFIFDVIEVGPDPQSIEPLIYVFKSSEVFYPLEISSTFHGQTTIDLVLFSRFAVDQNPFQKRRFQTSNVAQVFANDMQKVLPQLEQLLGKTAFVQAFRYTGRIDRLRGNIAAGPSRELIGLSREEYHKFKYRWLYSGIVSGTLAGMFGGVFIALFFLWPMYFAAKHQKPRWILRFLAGFLLGIPLALGLVLGGVHILFRLEIRRYSSDIPANIIFIMCSIGIGFIIFCFQLGLRRRWYIWGLVYALLAIPVAYISQPTKFLYFHEDSFFEIWLNLDKMAPWFLMHMAVFVSLFLIAKFLIWIAGLRKSRRSLSRPKTNL